jgi:sigma-B regulation protein RsbU (phosphoserine phosphatase)
MLPGPFAPWTPQRPLHLYATMRSASEVGGDLYDHFTMHDGRLCFMIGDVSGKGAAAAMFMARMRSLVRLSIDLWERFTPREVAPSTVMRAVNRELFAENGERMFVTLFLGFFDAATGSVVYANAGHPLPCVIRAGDPVDTVPGRPDPPIGVRPDMEYVERTMTLCPGDVLFAYTDGVTEAGNGGEELFGEERLQQVLRAAHGRSPVQVVEAVAGAVARFTGGAAPTDDMTMLSLQWQPITT